MPGSRLSTPRDPASYTPLCQGDLTAQLETQYSSVAYLRAIDQLRRFARANETVVLLEGEAGTGKTTLARQVHAWSARASGQFQTVVLSTLDDGVASSELFGHVPGAFTDARYQRVGHFASAAGGTLFLDEIGKASRNVQQKLLHAIEYREIWPVGSDRAVRINVRIVSATNIPLEQLVADDGFLPDLRARLSAFRVRVPPLRNRRADIPILVERSLSRYAASCGYSETPDVHDDLMAALRRAPWPDNLRQLDFTIHRILVDAERARVLTLDHCLDDMSYLRDLGGSSAGDTLTLDRVNSALERAAGNVSAAARALGKDRTTVQHFLARVRRAASTSSGTASNGVDGKERPNGETVVPHSP